MKKLIFMALFLTACEPEMERTEHMWGRAQIIEFRGMTCIEYVRDRGGSLDCDWEYNHV